VRCLGFVVVVVAIVAVLAGCQNAVAGDCAVSADCERGQLCVEGACVADAAPVGGEGEGEDIKPLPEEGEGEEGEGEVKGEGEGEVVVGEGEGEGEVDPCAGVVCAAFQECFAGSCEYVGEVCDAFQRFGVAAFDDVNTELSVASGSHVYAEFDPTLQIAGDHLLDAYALDTSAIDDVVDLVRGDSNMPPQIGLRVDVAGGGFDTFLGIFNDANCNVVAVNDDFNGQIARSRVDLGGGQINNSDKDIVVTTRNADVAGAALPYALATTPLLCGEQVDSAATFNGCARALSTRNQLCATNNPCERNAAGITTGFACCISTGVADADRTCDRLNGEPIFLFRAPGTGSAGCDPS
jgi:hypothetical protein